MLFGRKTRPLPIAEAQTMLSSGTPDGVVKQRLKEEGYTEEEVSKSIDQAHIKLGVAPKKGAAPAPWESPSMHPPEGASEASSERPPWESPPAQQPPPALGSQQPLEPRTQQPLEPQTKEPLEPQQPQQQPWQVPEGETPDQSQYEKRELQYTQEGQVQGYEGQDQLQGYEQAQQPSELQQVEQPPEPQQQAPEETQHAFAQEELQLALDSAISNLKTEIDSRLVEIEGKIESMSQVEETLKTIVSDLDEMKGRYNAMSERSEKFSEIEDQVLEIKGNISSVLQILKTTLPPVIKTLKEMKDRSKG